MMSRSNCGSGSKKDILLIMPPIRQDWDTAYKRRLPTTLLFLANYLYQHGHLSTIIDCYTLDYSLEEYLNKIRHYNPRVVGFTCCTQSRFITYQMIRKTKELFPRTKIVVGGPHFTPTAKEALERIPEIDVVVLGDGEETLLELLEAYDSNGQIDAINGIAFRKDGQIVFTKSRQMSAILNGCYDPKQFLIWNDRYTPFIDARNMPGQQALPVFTSVGCWFKCVYCNYSQRPHLRLKSVDDVIKEVEWKQRKYNHNTFQFVAADFMAKKDYVKELCRKLMELKPVPQWWTMGRADSDPSILQLMKKAGCYNFEFGLESGSKKILKIIRKNLNPEHVVAYAKECHRLGIRSSIFLMVSLPGETREDIDETKRIVKKLRSYVSAFLVYDTVIYPGTELEVMARNKGILPADFSWYEDIPGGSSMDVSAVPAYYEHFTPAQVGNSICEITALSEKKITKRLLKLFIIKMQKGNMMRYMRKFPGIHNFLKLVRKYILES